MSDNQPNKELRFNNHSRAKIRLSTVEAGIAAKAAFGKYDVIVPAEGEDSYSSYLAQRPNTGVTRDGSGSEQDSNLYERTLELQPNYDSLSLQELVEKYQEGKAANDKTLELDVLELIDTKVSLLAAENNWTKEIKDDYYDKLTGVALVKPIEGTPNSSETVDKLEAAEDLSLSNLSKKEKSIWSKYSERAGNLYLKAVVTFGQYMNILGSKVPSPKPKIGESLGDFEKRVSRYGVIKVIGVVALVVAAKYGLQELHHMPSTGVGIRGNNMPYVPDYPAPTVPRTDGLAQVVTTPEFSAAAHTVTPSETWFHTFKEMGITNANQQANLLHKLGPILKEKGWAYKMPDGLWGISHTGQLPDDVLELIQNSL